MLTTREIPVEGEPPSYECRWNHSSLVKCYVQSHSVLVMGFRIIFTHAYLSISTLLTCTSLLLWWGRGLHRRPTGRQKCFIFSETNLVRTEGRGGEKEGGMLVGLSCFIDTLISETYDEESGNL